tara:strand:- start:506 stop:1285 length:780 start_codon:yes stop_codon:yes gene_type:complete
MLSLGLGSQPTTECGIFGSYQCLELDGNSDYVALPELFMAQASLNAGTISCWVNIRDNDGAGSQSIVRIANDDSNENVTLQFHRSNTEFRAVYKIGGTYKEATYNQPGFDLNDYIEQGWIHLTMTWESDGSGTGEVKMYYNSVLKDTVAQTSNWDGESNPIDVAHIGASDDGASGFTDGFLDQIAIYREVKTEAQVQAMYNGGTMADLTTNYLSGVSRTNYTTSGLISYYQFEGNALDSSDNGYHGTLNGTAGFNTSQP